MTDKDKFELNGESSSARTMPAMEPPKCDFEKYRKHTKDFDLSEEEEADLLKNLWLIMAAFVDLGFGVDSVQLLPSSAQEQELFQGQNVGQQDGLANSKGVTHDD